MIFEPEKLIAQNISKEIRYRIPKEGVLKINVLDVLNSYPETVFGTKNGDVTINNTIIYYSPNINFLGCDEFIFSSKSNDITIYIKVIVDVVSTFKPKAHILVLLGEELIKSPVMA